jgi:Uma2 family endonuclease
MTIQTLPPLPLEEIEYPDSDGKPMAENTKQFDWITFLKENHDFLFRDRADVFVAGDLLWYPVQGKNTISTAPDTLIVFGRPKGHRGSYMQWREDHIAPQVVWEVLSPGNRAGEMQEKLDFYERYGVEEYYEYDPDRGELRGWLRQGNQLRPIEGIRGWTSPRTSVWMDLDGDDLVLVGPDGKRFIHDRESRVIGEEDRKAREAMETRLQQERGEKEAAQARFQQERGEKEAAQALAAQFAAKLRALGIDPHAK